MAIWRYFSLPRLLIYGLFAFLFHSIWSICKLSIPPNCPVEQQCLKSSLLKNPDLDLILFSSVEEKPSTKDADLLFKKEKFKQEDIFEENINLPIPPETRHNGTLFLHLFIIVHHPRLTWDWDSLARNKDENNLKVYRRMQLTKHAVPADKVFHLLSQKKSSDLSKSPVTHVKSFVEFNMLTDVEKFPKMEIPYELYYYFRITSRNEFLPIVTYNIFNDRNMYLKEITPSTQQVEITFKYAPISYGKLRLQIHVEASFKSIAQLGFSDKEIDDVKSIFADTHLYVFLTTMVVSCFHMLFDFLALKNDVDYWKNKKNTVGISVRTVMWRSFSQSIIFLYLMDEKTSYLVLVPSGLSLIHI